MNVDLPGIAILDYYNKKVTHRLYVHDKFGPRTEMPISMYFRQLRQMPELEQFAIASCEGSILDIGAGAGSHALELQNQGREITALEISPAACEVMQKRGVKKVICDDFFKTNFREKYDSLLLLMNGIGLCANLLGLKRFLQQAKTILKEDGKIICDSCDIAYMYDGIGFPKKYYGEASVRYEYKGEFTDWFQWLYLDPATFEIVAAECGWEFEVLKEDDSDQYLAELRPR